MRNLRAAVALVVLGVMALMGPQFRQEASPSEPEPHAYGAEWADIDPKAIDAFITRSAELGWRAALRGVAGDHPFFAQRLENYALGNWHLLLGRPRASRVLDIGSGFGQLALGLAQYYQAAIGVDALSSRVRYGALRAREDNVAGAAFARADGLSLPVRSRSIDLVTMNGVLEWAALYAGGSPGERQRELLAESRRVLRAGGLVAVAIENRYAAETLAGMPDTHTKLRLVPALPRAVADGFSRASLGQRYRTYLYSRSGYHRLLAAAGFESVRVLDLVSSYNDYDFIVEPADVATYELLWRNGLVRTFYARAGRLRRTALRAAPRLLGEISYAYLVVGGSASTSIPTLLDASHPIWRRAAEHGLPAGVSRFACQGSDVGTLVLVSHDGVRALGAVEVSVNPAAADAPPMIASTAVLSWLRLESVPRSAWLEGDLHARVFGAPA